MRVYCMLVTVLESRDTHVNERGVGGLWVSMGQAYSAIYRHEKGRGYI